MTTDNDNSIKPVQFYLKINKAVTVMGATVSVNTIFNTNYIRYGYDIIKKKKRHTTSKRTLIKHVKKRIISYLR